MDIFDLSGKRMVTRTIASQASSSRNGGSGFVNTTVDLNGELASGLYMVNITAGEQIFTQRLVIQQ